MGFSSKSESANGSSQRTDNSKNQAYPFVQDTFAPVAQGTAGSNNAIANLLGLNGASGSTEGFDNFRNSSGYNFIRDQGIEGINSNDASKGLLGSGSALKSISSYSSGLASQFLDKYLASLQGLTGSGLQAGQIISGAGNTSNSQGSSVNSSQGKSSSISLGSG